jgi:hypothetical protein
LPVRDEVKAQGILFASTIQCAFFIDLKGQLKDLDERAQDMPSYVAHVKTEST